MRSVSQTMAGVARKYGTRTATRRATPRSASLRSRFDGPRPVMRKATWGQRAKASGVSGARSRMGWPARAIETIDSAQSGSRVTSGGRSRATSSAASSSPARAWSTNRSTSRGSACTLTPGASRARRATRRGKSVTAWASNRPSRNARSDDPASKAAATLSVHSSAASAARKGAPRASASGVATMAAPCRTSNSSSKVARKRCSAWLIADCVRPARRAARVTLRSRSRWSRATSKLRSTAARVRGTAGASLAPAMVPCELFVRRARGRGLAFRTHGGPRGAAGRGARAG
jgi:hypothetical protein